MVSYSFEGNKKLWNIRDEEDNAKTFSTQAQPTSVKIPNEMESTSINQIEYDAEKWPLVQLMRLLRLYAAHRCLWDVNCRDNRNRKLRHAALIDITAALDFGVSKEQVVQKINILRATYRYEKKRIKQRIRRGLGARTRLKWFALADAFLRNVPKKGQREDDPSNSDSDLEDSIVFTINPESLVPLEQEVNEANPQEFLKHKDNSLQNVQEVYSDDSQFNLEWEMKNTSNPELNNEGIQTKAEKVRLECQQITTELRSSAVKQKYRWSLNDSLKFIKLLADHCVLFENSLELSKAQQLALEIIAKEMKFSYGCIEKRWSILQKVYQEENLKIQQDLSYQPKYKWWSEAQKLFEKFKNLEENTQKYKAADEHSSKDHPTEAIFLPENLSPESSNEDEDYEARFLQNPIPSVAPLSNVNEAMASLFNDNNEDDNLSQESSTNSTFPKENDSCSSLKFVWQGLEDDLLEGKWSLKHSVKFLRLYGVHRCLWDLNDPDYRSRALRNAAMEDIAASMGHGLTAAYVAKKIKIFRITYMQQRKRILDATEKGEKPEILLKWFPLADSFLRPHIGLRSIRSDAKEMPQFDYQYVYANLNLIDPTLLNDFRGKGTQNAIEIGYDNDMKE